MMERMNFQRFILIHCKTISDKDLLIYAFSDSSLTTIDLAKKFRFPS